MKKSLIALAVILAAILCLVSCKGEKTDAEKMADDYETALSCIETEDYETAYSLLKNCKDLPEAEKLLSRFCRISVSETGKDNSVEAFYNKHNLPLQTITTDADGRKQISNYSYDESNLLTGKTTFDFDGTTSTTMYIYDGDGKIIKALGEDETADYTYDVNGNLLKQVFSDSEGLSVCEDFTYDEKGYLTKSVVTETDEEPIIYTYSYDENGRKTERTHEEDGDIEKVQYFYDENGALTRQDSVVFVYNSRTAFVNDMDGNVIKKVRRYSNGNSDTYDYTYDQDGNLIKEVRTNSVGYSGTHDYIYDYDQNGYKISEVEYVSSETDSREFTTKLVFLPENSAKTTKNIYSVLGLIK